MHLLSEGQIKCFCFHLETQCLPDTAALTLLRYLKPRFLSSREHLGCIMQIFPHRDVDMWGCVWMRCFRGTWKNLNFDKEYLFGFETLVFTTSGILSLHKQLVTLQRESTTWNRIKSSTFGLTSESSCSLEQTNNRPFTSSDWNTDTSLGFKICFSAQE